MYIFKKREDGFLIIYFNTNYERVVTRPPWNHEIKLIKQNKMRTFNYNNHRYIKTKYPTICYKLINNCNYNIIYGIESFISFN